MTTRDFSEQHRQELLGLMQEAQVDDWDWWGHFVDWFSDLSISDDIHAYNSDITRYHQEVLDKHVDTEVRLKNIFAKVDEVDLRYQGLFQNQVDELDAITIDARKLIDAIDISSGAPIIAQDPSALSNYFYTNFNSRATQEAYDRVLQERIQHVLNKPEFSEEAWNSLDEAGREDLMRRFADEVAEILQLRMSRDLIFYNSESPDGYLSEYLAADGIIPVYPILVARFDWEVVSSTIISELRHVYQHEAAIDYEFILKGSRNYQYSDGTLYDHTEGVFPAHPFVDVDVQKEWYLQTAFPQPLPDTSTREGLKAYLELPREYDAWSFSGQLELELFKKTIKNYPDAENFLNSIVPPY